MKDRRILILVVGDTLILALVTIIGFARHDELATAGWRLLATFIPLLTAWLLVAPHLGAFDLRLTSELRQLWRPVWAMVLAAPLFGWLRGVWLYAPVLPIFVAVMGGVSALGIFAWRLIFWRAFSRGI